MTLCLLAASSVARVSRQPVGNHALTWDGTDSEGWNPASGITLLSKQLEGGRTYVRKITLIQ